MPRSGGLRYGGDVNTTDHRRNWDAISRAVEIERILVVNSSLPSLPPLFYCCVVRALSRRWVNIPRGEVWTSFREDLRDFDGPAVSWAGH